MKVPMKTIVQKDPATSDGSILKGSSFFPLVNALVYVDIDQGIH